MALMHHPGIRAEATIPNEEVFELIWRERGWLLGPAPWTDEVDVGFPPPPGSTGRAFMEAAPSDEVPDPPTTRRTRSD